MRVLRDRRRCRRDEAAGFSRLPAVDCRDRERGARRAPAGLRRRRQPTCPTRELPRSGRDRILGGALQRHDVRRASAELDAAQSGHQEKFEAALDGVRAQATCDSPGCDTDRLRRPIRRVLHLRAGLLRVGLVLRRLRLRAPTSKSFTAGDVLRSEATESLGLGLRRGATAAGIIRRRPGLDLGRADPVRPAAGASRAPGRAGVDFTSSECVPTPTTRPWSSTTIWSESTTVESRCAITSSVRSSATASIASRSSCSLTPSSEAVDSSSSRMGGAASSARAIARRWRSPPESMTPSSPTAASSPAGSRSSTSPRFTACSTAMHASSVASGAPSVRFSRRVPASTGASCST